MPHYTKNELEALYGEQKVSLGIVRPTEILDLNVEPVEREWKSQWQGVLNQFNLFSGPPKHLEKLPYKFSYMFRRADSGDKVHNAMIEDWELGVLYRKEVERLGDEQAAVANVKKNFSTRSAAPQKIAVSSWGLYSHTTRGS